MQKRNKRGWKIPDSLEKIDLYTGKEIPTVGKTWNELKSFAQDRSDERKFVSIFHIKLKRRRDSHAVTMIILLGAISSHFRPVNR